MRNEFNGAIFEGLLAMGAQPASHHHGRGSAFGTTGFTGPYDNLYPTGILHLNLADDEGPDSCPSDPDIPCSACGRCGKK